MKRTGRLTITGIAATGVLATAGVAAAVGLPHELLAPGASSSADSAVLGLQSQLGALQTQTRALNGEIVIADQALHDAQVARDLRLAAQRAAASHVTTTARVTAKAKPKAHTHHVVVSVPHSKPSTPPSHGSSGASGSTGSGDDGGDGGEHGDD
jgi:hypothetical protein